jgi:hypothetical protein
LKNWTAKVEKESTNWNQGFNYFGEKALQGLKKKKSKITPHV